MKRLDHIKNGWNYLAKNKQISENRMQDDEVTEETLGK